MYGSVFRVFLLHHQYQKSVPSAGSTVLDLKKYLKSIKNKHLRQKENCGGGSCAIIIKAAFTHTVCVIVLMPELLQQSS